eukprot:CAMPEP_0172032854 /NCGR_PEP_ID=MMETSP1041-20130122/20109_1 /TAXON_ID=464988 /ORGANISM="Hemiselmis andersenii, Strain CCMP439" /LENGTH=52 /DNA_ID=CAMNT_0012689557 /DNA_START=100 /DNA_END=254 /DNA_ORIENTATION=+
MAFPYRTSGHPAWHHSRARTLLPVAAPLGKPQVALPCRPELAVHAIHEIMKL